MGLRNLLFFLESKFVLNCPSILRVKRLFSELVNSLFYVYIHMWNYPGKMGTSAQLGNSLGIAFFRKVVN